MNQRIRITPWAELKGSDKWHGLLVGNGGSIALHPGFRYPSLYEAAASADRLPTTRDLFSSLYGGTTDFELVLLALSHASAVSHALGTSTSKVDAAYAEVRDALIKTVNAVHCTHDSVQPELVRIADFAKDFETVVTFNYDLTLYWAVIEGKNKHGNWLKDGFTNGRSFDTNWRRLRRTYGAEGATLVFHGHGSLILGRTPSGGDEKIVTGDAINLLSAITETWSKAHVAPLFVSEGTSTEKMRAIRRSYYLSIVYDEVLTDFRGKNLVVYGFSFADNDAHVLDALHRAPPARIAVSVHGPNGSAAEPFCHRVLAATRQALPSTQVDFFDAASPGVWCHSSTAAQRF